MPQLARTLPAVLLLALVGAASAHPNAVAGPVVAGPVAASISDTIEDSETGIRLDFTVNGGTVTEAAGEGWEYAVRGTVRPGETISVAASGNGTNFSTWHHVNEDRDATLTIALPGTDNYHQTTVPAGSSGSLAGSFVVPDDESTVEFTASISNAWDNPYGGGAQSLIARFIYDVVDPGPPVAEPEPGPGADAEPRPTEEREELECDEESYEGWTRATGATSGNAVVRFGDLWGEVNVRPDWADDDAYIFAELSTPLHHCDRIRTLPRSGAILSFSDMSTFVMREDTVIVLDIANKRRTLLGVLAGNIWVNFNRMIEDGSMEVELSQAMAGARGTTFVCEETGGASTVKVVEGTVEVTPNVGEPIMVESGETVTVTANGPGPVRTFDVDAEMAGWPGTAQRITADALADAGGGGGGLVLPTPALVLGILGLALMVTAAIGLGVERSRAAR